MLNNKRKHFIFISYLNVLLLTNINHILISNNTYRFSLFVNTKLSAVSKSPIIYEINKHYFILLKAVYFFRFKM